MLEILGFFSSIIGVLILQHFWAIMNNKKSILIEILSDLIHSILMTFSESYRKADMEDRLEVARKQNEFLKKKREEEDAFWEEENFKRRSELVNKMMTSNIDIKKQKIKRDIESFNSFTKNLQKCNILGLSITYYDSDEKQPKKYAVVVSGYHSEAGPVYDNVELFDNLSDATKSFYAYEFRAVMDFLTHFILKEEASKYYGEVQEHIYILEVYDNIPENESLELEQLFYYGDLGQVISSTFEGKYYKKIEGKDLNLDFPSPIPHPFYLIDLYNKKHPNLIKRINSYKEYFGDS